MLRSTKRYSLINFFRNRRAIIKLKDKNKKEPSLSLRTSPAPPPPSPFLFFRFQISLLESVNRFFYYHAKCYTVSSTSTCKTIYSLSSGSGKCGVAVIRVSGPCSGDALQKLCKKIIPPRVARIKKLFHPETNDVLDRALVLWFPGPHSFTGEDCAEFHVHGGPAVISAVLSALGSVTNLQPASAGEFTKQAFINGKMDLTEVEGLGDLIHAETEIQRKQALRQLDGELGQLYQSWRSRLVKCMANVEAYIDFAEEENIEDDVLDVVHADVLDLRKEISSHLKDNRKGERLREGVRITIVGMPNAGKSSLLNLITQRPAAIVSPMAGTTRDVVETALNIAGFPVLVSDTAGLRSTDDVVEREGVVRALDRMINADLKILLMDSCAYKDRLNSFDSFSKITETFSRDLDMKSLQRSVESFENDDVAVNQNNDDLNRTEQEELSDNSSIFLSSDTIVVFNKSDLIQDFNWNFCHQEAGVAVCMLSCKTGHGLEQFMELLVEKVGSLCGNPLEGPPSLTQNRHRFHLKGCLKFLDDFLILEHSDDVLAAERLRMAARELGQITGIIMSEDILDVLFRDFCIGK